MKLKMFTLLTFCGFVIFAAEMTFVPVLPTWANYGSRAVLLIVFAALWWFARYPSLSAFRPVFFAYFTAALSVSLAYFFGDWALTLFRLTIKSPSGIAVAKFSQALVIIVAILVMARLSGENLQSLYLCKGRLLFGAVVGLTGAALGALLALQQPAVRSLGAAKLVSLAPWVLLFVVSNALMEELLFRGLFLKRYEPLLGRWLAVLSTALAFTLAHMQVKYAPDLMAFMVVLFALSTAWGWLMQKTGGLWGSTVFHAGADLLIILPLFKTLGAA